MSISKHFKFYFTSYLQFTKCFSYSTCQLNSKYFITTPIFYVNAAPHLGHLHSLVLADALHSIHRLLGIQNTIFSTGTDEHGLKVEQSAMLHKQDVHHYCDKISEKYRDVCKNLSLSNTHFIRTTENRHKETVIHFWNELAKRDHIYEGCYEGWYCTAEEAFLPSSQVIEINETGVIKKVSSETRQPVEWMKERNYMFTLSKFTDELLYWLKGDVIHPKIFADKCKAWIVEGLNDLSISREKSRCNWGISVPNDNSQIIYVWLDALVNYLTAGGYPKANFTWPVDCHIIGKDILRFHGIYWPAFLIAAGLEPPRSVLCHSHWLVNDEKMSKSKGNVIDAQEIISKYKGDSLRYFLLREATLPSDANYNEVKLQRTLNSELANTLGNLLSRCSAPAINKKQIFPQFHQEKCSEMGNDLIKSVLSMPNVVKEDFLKGNFYIGINKIMDCLHKTNAFVEHQKPWELAKSEEKCYELDTVLHIALETLRISGILLQPVIPNISNILLTKLGVSIKDRMWTHLECFPHINNNLHNLSGKNLGNEKVILFNKIKM
ncbi:methionine--tRNA ligase, mitochondrial-like isoform X1 [Centruroides sculpturatus]|uniref:methionine--tRNA ligase, mitochondrial-like isoform X1 n=1 Tax=Centruroides sculpturatus TaxID=218467 RepID=UPI000C6D2F28|nr:methionine--tRNA ligase, mitochondrial-like isoform X1 [Centruroides sculpturatus]XP_023231762.1 methionine--tRNA ligase, mitochondrial-like isoform X1 [Centruroides sculpturatus]XP_023231763.1 methionine--tRNA ligase, mitochondrial-like isoform X1 [Centruroides sculpturatus]